MSPAIQRIVTGHAPDGRSVITMDGLPSEVINDFGGNPGLVFTEIWRTAGGCPQIDNGPDPTSGAFSLAATAAGSTIRVIDFPASRRDPANPAATDPGDFVSPMHRTQSVDYGIVLDGEMRLLLTDSERVLTPGCIVVQRGTDHAWANRSPRPARMAFILVAGQFAPEIAPLVGDITP